MIFNPRTMPNLAPQAPSGLPPIDVNLRDLASTSQGSSFSGLPPWAQELLKGIMGKYIKPGMSGYQKSIADLNAAPGFIEQQRKTLDQEFGRDIQAPVMGAVGSALGQAGARGTAGSSMFGDTMSRLQQGWNAGAQQAHSAGDIWAAGKNIDVLPQKVQANQGFMGMLTNLLGQTGTSTSRSTSFAPNLTGLNWAPPAY